MRLIDADYILSVLNVFSDREHGNERFLFGVETAQEIVKDAPTIEPKPRWIPVTERLPENEVGVLICAERRPCGIVGGERKTVRVISTAFYTDGKMNTEESIYNWDSDVDMQYDEENDAYIVPEGWWEVVNYGEEFSAVDDFVTHWMPLPEPYKEDKHD